MATRRYKSPESVDEPFNIDLSLVPLILYGGQTVASVLSVSATPATGITIGTNTINDEGNVVQVLLSYGTAGQVYDIACKFTLSGGTIDQRCVELEVLDC